MNKEQIETVEREKQVPNQLELLRNNLDRMDSALATLRDNLSCALRDDLVFANDTEEDRDLVPLAAHIREIDRRLHIMLSTVKYFNEACEL